jgi:hypothetical protein
MHVDRRDLYGDAHCRSNFANRSEAPQRASESIDARSPESELQGLGISHARKPNRWSLPRLGRCALRARRCRSRPLIGKTKRILPQPEALRWEGAHGRQRSVNVPVRAQPASTLRACVTLPAVFPLRLASPASRCRPGPSSISTGFLVLRRYVIRLPFQYLLVGLQECWEMSGKRMLGCGSGSSINSVSAQIAASA